MNSTINSLVLSKGFSYGIVNPIKSIPTFTTLKNFRISKIFSTFYSENNIFGSSRILKSSFNKCLGHAVTVSSLSDILSQQENQHRFVSGFKYEVQVIDTSFNDCKTVTEDGGALLFDRRILSASIDRCSFQRCSTQKTGGCFYITCDNLTVSRTCFCSCNAQESSHAFFINLNSPNFTAKMSDLTIVKCAKTQKPIGKSSVLLMNGVYRTQFINSTDNHALSFSAAFGSVASSNLTFTFSEYTNCSSTNIFRALELKHTLLVAFCNFVKNRAEESLIHSSSKNNILNSAFTGNVMPSICTGNITYLQMSDCVLDRSYSFNDIPYLRTPGMFIREYVHLHDLNFAFSGKCRIPGEKEGMKQDEVVKRLIDSVPHFRRMYIQLFSDKIAFEQKVPQPHISLSPEHRSIVNDKNNDAEKNQKKVSKKKKYLKLVENDSFDEFPIKNNNVAEGGSKVTPYIGVGRRMHDWKDEINMKNVMTPSAIFTPSQTFYNSRTFLPSLMFTASISPAQSLVPYVLYSAAGFIVFSILTSFLFLRSSDVGYNLMNPSESADSRLSDYASSTSTTLTLTGESSSVVV